MKTLLKRMRSFLSGEGGPRAAVDNGVVSDTLDSTQKGFSNYLIYVIMFLTEGHSENTCFE